jgi:hypothetical protein
MNDINNKKFSTEEVEEILSSLTNEKNKKAFLEKIYVPGNKEIAKLLMPYNSSIIDKELMFALQNNDNERIMEMTKKEIDKYFEEGRHISIRDKIKTWNNVDITNYAMSQVKNGTTKKELEHEYYMLEYF